MQLKSILGKCGWEWCPSGESQASLKKWLEVRKE
jgi:hypothetical protein